MFPSRLSLYSQILHCYGDSSAPLQAASCIPQATYHTPPMVHEFLVCRDPDYYFEYVQGHIDGLQAGVSARDILNIQDVRLFSGCGHRSLLTTHASLLM